MGTDKTRNRERGSEANVGHSGKYVMGRQDKKWRRGKKLKKEDEEVEKRL